MTITAEIGGGSREGLHMMQIVTGRQHQYNQPRKGQTFLLFIRKWPLQDCERGRRSRYPVLHEHVYRVQGPRWRHPGARAPRRTFGLAANVQSPERPLSVPGATCDRPEPSWGAGRLPRGSRAAPGSPTPGPPRWEALPPVPSHLGLRPGLRGGQEDLVA